MTIYIREGMKAMVPTQDIEYLDRVKIEKPKIREYHYFCAASWLAEKVSLLQKHRKGSNVNIMNNSVLLAKPVVKVFR